jgi:8-oxo-dGTP pyrophosphatase MutT (NUDIX family)
MGLNNYAYFQVTTKAIVKRDTDILLLTTPDGYYDFPGGRIDESEVDLSLHEVLTRELREELGNSFKFNIKDVAFIAKRRYNSNNKDHRIVAIFFEVLYKDGDIKLSNEHVKSEWVKQKSILNNPEKFISKDEYNQYKKYCEPSI